MAAEWQPARSNPCQPVVQAFCQARHVHPEESEVGVDAGACKLRLVVGQDVFVQKFQHLTLSRCKVDGALCHCLSSEGDLL